MQIQFINFADSIAVKSGDEIIGVIVRVIDTQEQMTVWAYEHWQPFHNSTEEEAEAIRTKIEELNNPPNPPSQRS